MIPPILIKSGAIALLFGTVYISGCVHGEKEATAALETFKAQVAAEGRAAQAAADATKAKDIARKEASDASYRKALVVLGADIERMRRARASANPVPATPPDSKCPDGWACFDRAELESAIRRLDAGVSGIVAEGDSVRLRLDTAIRWANGR
jgi:hypothetical protein